MIITRVDWVESMGHNLPCSFIDLCNCDMHGKGELEGIRLETKDNSASYTND